VTEQAELERAAARSRRHPDADDRATADVAPAPDRAPDATVLHAMRPGSVPRGIAPGSLMAMQRLAGNQAVVVLMAAGVLTVSATARTIRAPVKWPMV